MCSFTLEEENILMLANSRQIVKEVNNTTQLDEALLLVVQRSKSSMAIYWIKQFFKMKRGQNG